MIFINRETGEKMTSDEHFEKYVLNGKAGDGASAWKQVRDNCDQCNKLVHCAKHVGQKKGTCKDHIVE
jgi:hypothetical protein